VAKSTMTTADRATQAITKRSWQLIAYRPLYYLFTRPPRNQLE